MPLISHPRPVRRSLQLAALGTALALPLAAGSVALLATPARAEGPASVADLASRLQDAVVNVSTTQTTTSSDDSDDDDDNNGGDSSPGPQQPQSAPQSAPAVRPPVHRLAAPQVPPGSPFEDFFNQFFKNHGSTGADTKPHKTASLGSGFVIDPAGIVITNNHVIEGADDIEVNFTDGTQLKATLIGRDKKVDVAVLKVTPTHPLKAVRFADSDRIRVGDWVMAIGNPFGLGGTVTLGIISARNRDINSGPYDDYLQTDAAINRGNSGGPLFNMDGDVVGINTAIISPSGGSIGIGFSVPADTAGPVIDQLRQYGHTRRGWLGVRIQQVTDDIADSLSMGPARGALIAGIDDSGPAKPADIEPGDVVLSFNGHDIKEMRDLPRIVADTPVGKAVPVIVLRKGQQLTRTVTVGLLKEDDQQQASLTPPVPDKPTVQKALGLELSTITGDLRAKFKLGDSIKGVVITSVDSDSPAADKQVQAGDVVVEVAQEAVSSPSDVAARVDALRKQGKKSALLLLSNAQGELRFVAVALN